MIVPRPRLLLWSALALVPFAVLAGVAPETRSAAAAIIALFVLIAGIDALLSPPRLRGLALHLPEVVRASKDRETIISASLRNETQTARKLRIALQLPPALGAVADETMLAVPAGTEWSRFDWPIRPVRRGRFQINRARVEAVSPLGFWAAWKSLDTGSEVRVYPNLQRERRNLAALFLNRGAVGLHAQRMVGKGREFEKLREYISGDSLDEVHWKATAKRGHPMTKVFQIERTQEIYVVIDTSRLSARPDPKVGARAQLARARRDVASTPSDKTEQAENTLERFITAGLAFGLAAEHQGDLFGLITFSDRVETFLRAANGTAHYHACRDALYTLQAREVTPDFDELSTFIRLRLRRRALLFFLTPLDDPVLAESFVRNAGQLARQHLVLVNMIQPGGVRPLFSDANVATAEELYDDLAAHLRWQNLRELEKVLGRRGVRFSLLQSDQLAVDLVSQYLNVKQRQLL